MKTASIRRATMDAIVAQAEREFPFECCGFIIGDDKVEEVRPIANIQNAMHAKDPAGVPARRADRVPDGAEGASGGDERSRCAQARAAGRLPFAS